MMSMRVLTGVLVGMLCLGAASAEYITVDPQKQEIPISGNGTYNITISCTSSDTGNHVIQIWFLNYSSQSLTDKMCGALGGSEGCGRLNYSWSASEEGTYNFTLTVWFNPEEEVQVGEEFAIKIVDSWEVGDAEVSPWPLAVATAYTTAIPELITAALVGVGLASVIIWRRWG